MVGYLLCSVLMVCALISLRLAFVIWCLVGLVGFECGVEYCACGWYD